MRFDRIPGEAILIFSTLPQILLNVKSASTRDAPRQKDKEILEFEMFPNPSTFAFWNFNCWIEVCSDSFHPRTRLFG